MRIVQWIAIAGMTLFFPISALAAINLGSAELGTAGVNAGISTASTGASLTGIVGLVINVALNLLGAILFVLFVYAGFLWTTAQGDEKQVKKAKDIMGNAVIGMVVTLLAYSVTFYGLTYVGDDQSDVGLDTLVTTADNAGINTGFTDPIQNIGYYIGVVLNLLGVVLLLIFIYAGFLWTTAQGDGKQVDKAKMMMRNAIVGLIITLLSRAMATFVIEQLAEAEVAHVPEIIHSTLVT
jgi:uncharacterized membrane protein